jgi:TonB-linked SusC/RagA family outer membrane protein
MPVAHKKKTNASSRNVNRLNFTWDNQINAEKTFNKHTIKGTGVFSIYDFQEEDFLYEVQDLPQNTSFYNLGAANVRNLSVSQYTMNRLVSYMARFNYDFDHRYLLTVSNRWDGSSKLGEGHKWASFPSAALAWRISEEAWLKGVRSVSTLKLRLSYGFTGNNNISAYQSAVNANYLYNYDFNGTIANGIGPSGIANRALTWERTGEFNVGLDFGFFKSRVSGSVDLYSRTSEDLLLNRKLPVPIGWDEMIDNIGSVKNEGIEVSLRTINVHTNDWLWETSFVFTKNNNSVVETNLGAVDDVVNGLFIGEPINVHYNYQFIGIWQLDESDEATAWGREPGMPKIKDVSGPDGVPDGRIDAQYDRVIIGKPIPDWTGSFFTKLSYKNIDLSASVYTEQGAMKRSNFFNDLIYTSRNTVKHNYWTVTNPSNDAPSPAFLDDIYWGRKGARLQNYRNTSFTRVQNVTLGYTVPKDLINRINMERLRIYVNVTNPILITSFTGHDPEFGDKGVNEGPSFITYQVGINATF